MPKNGQKGRRRAEGQRRRCGKGQGSAHGNCRSCRKHDVYVGNDIRPGAEERVCVLCQRDLLYGRLYLALRPRLDEYVIHCIREYIVPESLTMCQRRNEMTDAFWKRFFSRSRDQRARLFGLMRHPRIWSGVLDHCMGVDPFAAPIPSPFDLRDRRKTRMIEEMRTRLNPPGVDPSGGRSAVFSRPASFVPPPSILAKVAKPPGHVSIQLLQSTPTGSRGLAALAWGIASSRS